MGNILGVPMKRIIVSQNYGYHFGGSNSMDYGILGSILGSPYFGKLPYSFTRRASALEYDGQAGLLK